MKSFGGNTRGQLLFAVLTGVFLCIIGILPQRLLAQESSLGVSEEPAGARQLATAEIEKIAGISKLLELTEQEIGDLTNMMRNQRLPALDVPVAENLEARGLSVSERNAMDELLARKGVKNWESLQRLNQEGKLADQEKSVVAKLAALGDRESRMREGVKKLRKSGAASERATNVLEQLERLTARRSMESLLFMVRETFDPNIGGKANWSALNRRDMGQEDPHYIAFARCPVGGRFPVRMEGEGGILFWVTLLDGTDDRLRLEVRNHEDDCQELTLHRDKPNQFAVAGRAYSLLFPSTDVMSSQPRATGQAFLIVNYHPAE